MTRTTAREIAVQLCFAAAASGEKPQELLDRFLLSELLTFPLISAGAVIGLATLSVNSMLFSSRNQIKGLTTSVGLWACGVIGLTAGAGYYTVTLVSFFALLLTLSAFPAIAKDLKDRYTVLWLYNSIF